MKLAEQIHYEKLEGYDNLTIEQQKRFEGIFKKYMLSKGTDAREDIDIKSVEMHGRGYKISTIQWGLGGYAILDPINQTWY